MDFYWGVCIYKFGNPTVKMHGVKLNTATEILKTPVPTFILFNADLRSCRNESTRTLRGEKREKKKQPIEESRDISLIAVIKLTSTMSRQGCLDTPNAYGHRVKPCTRYCSLSVRRPSFHSSLTPPRLLESACLPFQSPLSPTF